MTPNQADFQNLMGILLSTVTYLVKKIHKNRPVFSGNKSQTVEKCPISQC